MDMERQEFDLNDYSLVVKDGKAVLERKYEKEPKGFKPGDVLSNELGVVVIYAGTEDGDRIVTYAGYWSENGVFTSVKNTGWGRMGGFDYAETEQKAMLFAEIEKRGYVWDAEKLELREKRWRAKKGEEYWTVYCTGKVKTYIEEGIEYDDDLYSAGNYFRTEETAEKVANEVRKVFEKYKEEQK